MRGLITLQDEIVARDDLTLTFVGSHGFGTHPGHLLVIPHHHVENIYELTDKTAFAIDKAVRRAAIALRFGLGCEGISIRQHNEPAGDQDVWHYHVHVMPRYKDDGLYESKRVLLSAGEGIRLAKALRPLLAKEIAP